LYTSIELSVASDRYEALLDEIRAEFPRFRLVRKADSRVQRAIHKTLVVLTAGRMTRYLSDYQTTIGATVYVSPDWDDRSSNERYVTMRHELVHIRQFRRYTVPVMALLYLLVPAPMGFAWFRARFEKAAYEETIRAAASIYGPEHIRDGSFRDHIIGQFTGPSYGWMWPFRRSLERWYDRVLAEVTA
jgi:hypothetical protein